MDRVRWKTNVRRSTIICAAVISLVFAAAAHAQTGQVQSADDCKLRRVPIERIDDLVNRCFSDKELAALKGVFNQRREELGRENQRLAEDLAGIAGVSRTALAQIFRIVTERDVEPEELPKKLAIKLRIHRTFLDELAEESAKTNADERWIRIRSNVEAGRYDEAREIAASVKADALSGTGPDQSSPENPKAPLAAAADAAIGKIDLIQSLYVDAVRNLRMAVELATDDADIQTKYQKAVAQALYWRTEDEWNEGALVEAADLYKELIKTHSSSKAPELWAEMQCRLGLVLLRLGAGRRNLSLLDDAAAAFRSALQIWVQTSHTDEWLKAQTYLATALFHLGVRKGGTDELQQSADAYKSALATITPENSPEKWASLQNGLGASLWSLGNRADGTGHLQDAVIAFSEAQKGMDPERHPRDWGALQNNLGAALFALAERETGTQSLIGAVEAFKASLAAYQEASAPYFIVGVRKNLDRAEAMLKQRQAEQPLPETNRRR